MKNILTLSALALSALLSSQANATTVATISGCYDCVVFDTPTLVFNNSTGGDFINSQMVLTGYQGVNDKQVATVNLGTIGSGQTTFNWGSLPGVNGSTTPFNLTAYDYDDEFIGTQYQIPTTDCGYAVGCVSGGGPQWYAHTGNFFVTFTATVKGGAYDGLSIYSQFSPNDNATGGFVGWEGLDENGYSESPYDIHNGVITGHLADINLGLPPPLPVPEPDTYLMLLAGLGLIGFSARRSQSA